MNSKEKAVYVVAILVCIVIVAFCLGYILADYQTQPLVAPFADIQGHWAAPYIEQIRLAGLTAGCGAYPPMYCPDAPLTRAEAAVLLARLLKLR